MFSVARLGLVAISVAGNAIAQPLEVFRDCDVCPEMIELPMGAFMMGTKPNEIRVAWLKNLDFAQTYRKDSEFFSKSDETPRHRVDVNIPIAMGRNEVTYDEWMACVQDGGCNGYVPPDRMAIRSGDWIGGNHPVTRVSFHDAQAYTEWLNLKLGTNTYRLPTEAEWEYAGRAGTETRFAQGDEITTDRVNFSGEATEYYTFVERPWLETRRVPVPVDELDAANAWGLRHMSGNVEEWTSSCYTKRYAGWASTSRWLAESRRECNERVTRGGWFDAPMHAARTAQRTGLEENTRLRLFGFRIVKELK